MLDLALFLVVVTMFVLGLRRPFLWVLTYIYIDILAPQKIGWSLTQAAPLSFISFVLAFCGWIFFDPKANTRFTLRQALLVALLIWCFITLQWADFPDTAQAKWDWVWRSPASALA